MSKPTQRDWDALKRFARYLLGASRVIQLFEYQSKVKGINVWTDTDYAGCSKTRKSTSGGIVMHGTHLLKSWSSTQSVVALSSGEAEYYGLVKGASIGLGIQSMFGDFGVSVELNLKSDASAACGIARRRGLGKVRHIEVAQLWLQDLVSKGRVKIEKVPGTSNLSDILTKHVQQSDIAFHMEGVRMHIEGGRHHDMPAVAA